MDEADMERGGETASSITPQGSAHFQRTTRARFEALALWGLGQLFRDARTPASFWAADRERLLALVHTGEDLANVRVTLLARDAAGRYRPVRHSPKFPTVRFAEDAISGPMGHEALKMGLEEAQGEAGVDLFKPVADDAKLSAEFRYLRDGLTQSAARDLLRELQRWIKDPDGNLVKDFQTTGYSARIWEIYLRIAFMEMNLQLGEKHVVPDFELIRGDKRVYVEATTVNASGGGGAGLRKGAPPPWPDDLMRHLEEVMPLRFGSPLHSKMQKRYWEANHVQGHPFVLAIADFHQGASMTWSHTALPIYLYGRSAELIVDDEGRASGREKILAGFERKGERLLPFFEQEATEHVSAVLFSNAGTIAKFNRMGARAGFGDRFIALRRSGVRHRPGTDAYEPIPFSEDVEAGSYDECWSDELSMFHNPNARVPVEEGLFPGIAHYHLVDGEVTWHGPPFPVLFSTTTTTDLLGRRLIREEFERSLREQ